MKSGIITLYSSCDEPLVSAEYVGSVSRAAYLSAWRRKYAKRFQDCYYHLEPYTRDEHDNRGVNLRKKHLAHKDTSEPVRFLRPKAEYQNKQWI